MECMRYVNNYGVFLLKRDEEKKKKTATATALKEEAKIK